MRLNDAARGLPVGRLLALMSNRYVLVLLVFSLWVIFFDANSVINIYRARRRVASLEEKKRYYDACIAADEARLRDLKTSRMSLEKFARERYYMRRANEDVYVVE